MSPSYTPRQRAFVAAATASAVVRIAIMDDSITWAPCMCGCGVSSVHVRGIRGWRAFSGVSRVVGEA